MEEKEYEIEFAYKDSADNCLDATLNVLWKKVTGNDELEGIH